MRITATRPFAPALASVLLLVSAGTAGHAQDGRGFFEQLFGSPARPAPAAVPTYQPRSAEAVYHYHDRRASRPRLRARYAALPRPADDTKLAGKQPVDQKAIADNPTKAILNDKTLQPGDIVVLPSGPRVFTGGNDKTHRISEFEDVKNSRLVDRKTRQQLLAMMVPVGAMPADQARRVLAQKRKLAHPDEIGEVEAQYTVARNEAGSRVISPWVAAR